MGVWIETLMMHLSEVSNDVTPFVGVWIETENTMKIKKKIYVTPFVGVWIETENTARQYETSLRHTLRGCVD